MELDEPIEIAAYDPAWPETFESEKSWIRQALMGFDVQIEHFGGTAVPGLTGHRYPGRRATHPVDHDASDEPTRPRLRRASGQ